jgi:hypothetical protein
MYKQHAMMNETNDQSAQHISTKTDNHLSQLKGLYIKYEEIKQKKKKKLL